ncbi:MAG: hypothetical protein ABI946_08735, partial [Chthoniobacterales bacterium]
MPVRRSLFLLLALPSLALAAEKSSSLAQWNEEPKTSASGAWLAQQIVIAQANDRPEIAQTLTDLFRTGNVSPACAKDGVFIFTKSGADKKQGSIFLRKGWDGKDERLVAARDGKIITVADVSSDGSLVAYSVAEGKAVERKIRFFAVSQEKDLSDELPAANYNTVSIAPDKKGAWYTRVEPAGTRVFFHVFGTEPVADKFIFGETYFYEPLGPNDLISSEVTRSGGHLLLSVRRGAEAKRIDLYAQELEEPDQKIRAIIHAMDNRFSWVSKDGDLFVLTDKGAPKQRVVKVAIDDPSPLKWQEIVPEGEETLTAIEIVDDRLFVSSEKAGATKTRIFTLEGKEAGQIVTPKVDLPSRVYFICPAGPEKKLRQTQDNQSRLMAHQHLG